MGYKGSLGSSCSLCWTLVGRMRPGSSLGFALFCSLLGEVVAYNPWDFFRGEAELWRYREDPSLGYPHTFSQPWAWVDVSQLQAAAPLHPVAVQCQEAQVMVTVHRDLFGTGRLVRAAELSLGSAGCRPGAQSDAESTVTFVAGLHECGSTLQVRRDAGVRGCAIPGSAVWGMEPSTGVVNGGCCGQLQGNELLCCLLHVCPRNDLVNVRRGLVCGGSSCPVRGDVTIADLCLRAWVRSSSLR